MTGSQSSWQVRVWGIPFTVARHSKQMPMAQSGPRVSPPTEAAFAMMMLGTTAHGDAYTFQEYDRMFRNTGFARSEIHELLPLPGRVIVSYK